MRLEPTEDETAIAEVFDAFFASECPPDRVRAAEDLGHDADAWARFAQTGAPGMAVPEACGGGGADLASVALVAAGVGRHVAPLPFVEHAVATTVLAAARPDHPALPTLMDGSQVATVALTGHGLVPAGAVADVILFPTGADAISVATGPPPGQATPNGPRLPLAPRSLDGGEELAASGWARCRSLWQALMATALAALGQRALEIGVEYVQERHQFGVPVGSFQGVQHGLADAVTVVDGAVLLASRAVDAIHTDSDDADQLAAMAFLFASEAAAQATGASLQYHGGYGYAEEYDIQLYHRRAVGWPLQAGDPGTEYQRLAAQLLPQGA